MATWKAAPRCAALRGMNSCMPQSAQAASAVAAVAGLGFMPAATSTLRKV
ncbi:hypothetical protein OV079_16090 [Nannocystis pusilla]|uniref:Uncharacterized protein n=1 Tax=Nannocystis pusilla TaxID=889268 RepID=A0A9X3EPW0_9BACT|nr:hypothetical protein [Nannocystis pusilla]MCY1007050.1 hypothetical protein [Nannocystis pusilla]